MGSPQHDGAEPINFRAALAAFESNASSSSVNGQSRLPALRPTPGRKPWPAGSSQHQSTKSTLTWRKSQDDALDPIPRSNSTPKIRTELSSNPFAAAKNDEPSSSITTPSSAGLLKSPWNNFDMSDDAGSRLRKSESGTSLRELMQKSLPDPGLNRSRSKSLAGRDSTSLSGRSTPAGSSDTNSPRLGVKNIIALYGHNDTSAASAVGKSSVYNGANTISGAQRTSSPLPIASQNSLRGRHMLDLSNDDNLHNHAVMQPRPQSAGGHCSAPASQPVSPVRNGANTTPQKTPPPFSRTISYTAEASRLTEPPPQLPARVMLQPPTPSRGGSGSSTTSSSQAPQLPSRSATGSNPRLPPRRGIGNGAFALSEFGQLPDTASLSKVSPQPSGSSTSSMGPPHPPVAYATYTPGSRRHGTGASDELKPHAPALPPRSATVGQGSRCEGLAPEDNGVGYVAYRQPSPAKPGPRSPSMVSLATLPPTKADRPEPPPRPTALDGNAGGFRFGGSFTQPPSLTRPRVTTTIHNRGKLGGLGSDPSSSHSGNVRVQGHFKSPSNVFTSISLSDDATQELKKSLESDIFEPEGGAKHQPPPRNRSLHAANRSIGSAGNASPNLSQLSAGKALWDTASSALPLAFRGNSSSTGRALAEGAPSKQPQIRGTSPYGDAMMMSRPGEGLQTRAVLLASPTIKAAPRSMEPTDAAARKRYETLFDDCMRAQSQKASKLDSEDGTIRAKKLSPPRSTGETLSCSIPKGQDEGAGVQALRGWFEPASRSAPTKSPLKSASMTLRISRIRKIWKRSQLPDKVLAEIWEAAITFQKGNTLKSLEKEAFVRGMAAIDAELSRRATRRRACSQRSNNSCASSVRGGVSPLLKSGALGGPRRVSDSSTHSNGSARRVPPPPKS